MFDVGPFKGQQSFETGWFSVPDRDVPVPRPGQASPLCPAYIHKQSMNYFSWLLPVRFFSKIACEINL